ncbi:MFS transporter [Paraburkholderia susongensis]|uniref:Nitrate/nitrite transporter NarK n=1 Tax=Paraburkholderia susongensis TaxID=1515439 RepID=A0A1X7KYT7_9BURK|nr:MFS transporter [Paraburkholderia susongensis]SMG46517.1 Nitrate/nitrite transporter NarK [Paraburkholderia susongensis]
MSVNKGARWKAVVASTIGNALEWYDFLIFGYLSVIIAKQFFPSDGSVAPMLLTTATFGIGFIIRPIAGIAIGLYADRVGRKAALSFVILLMLVSTAMLAFSPTYHQVGIIAPIIVVVSRILQGISVGGEFGSATALLIEYAPPHRRGFYGSWQMFSQSIGVFLATLMGALLTSVFTAEALESWAWRIPFVVGLIIGPIGFYIRRNMEDPAVFLAEAKAEKVSISQIFRHYPAEMFVSFALSAVTNIMVYVLIAYLPIYAVQSLRTPANAPFMVLTVALLVRMMLVPCFGHLSDKIGRKKIMAVALVVFAIVIYPAFIWLTRHPTTSSLMMVELLFALLMAATLGPVSTTLAELFPTHLRSTGLSITYNLAASVLGGFTPFLLTWLVAKTGDPLMPAHYLVGFLVLGAISLRFYREGDWKSLPAARLDVGSAAQDVDLMRDGVQSVRKA